MSSMFNNKQCISGWLQEAPHTSQCSHRKFVSELNIDLLGPQLDFQPLPPFLFLMELSLHSTND